MGAAANGGKGFKERARVCGERPIGAASCRQQYNCTTRRHASPEGVAEHKPVGLSLMHHTPSAGA